MRRFLIGGLTLLGLVASQANQARADLILTAGAAGSQASTVSGVTTENFNSFSTGTYTSLNTAVGTLSSAGMSIRAAGQYGGAGGTGNFFAIGSDSGQLSAMLTLTSPQSYFGFWLSATDSLNEVEFFSSGRLVGTFDAELPLSALPSSYNGNPNTGQDSTEKFAYMNVFGTNGTTFNQVEIINKALNTSFETDNWSVANGNNTPTGAINFGSIGVVPEPSSFLLIGTGMVGAVVIRRYRKRERTPR